MTPDVPEGWGDVADDPVAHMASAAGRARKALRELDDAWAAGVAALAVPSVRKLLMSDLRVMLEQARSEGEGKS